MNFKEALIAHLQGEKVQCKGGGTWKPLMEAIGENLIRYVDAPAYMSGFSFRIAPRTILVNGVEVPAPEKDAPKNGVTYFVAATDASSYFREFNWCGQDYELLWLEHGLVYLDKESAIARAKAMLITQEVK